jgi:hypothetical protein
MVEFFPFRLGKQQGYLSAQYAWDFLSVHGCFLWHRHQATGLKCLAFKMNEVLARGGVARLNRAVRPEGGLLITKLFHGFAAITLRAACPAASSDPSRAAYAVKKPMKICWFAYAVAYSGSNNSSVNGRGRA